MKIAEIFENTFVLPRKKGNTAIIKAKAIAIAKAKAMAAAKAKAKKEAEQTQ